MVQVITHRGVGTGPFENTLTGFQTAISWGVDCIECDVRSSSDGVLALIHDFSLERLSNGVGKVAEHTWDELKGLKVSDTERIPTLVEFFELVRSYDELRINLDVKIVDIESQLLHLIQEYDLLHRIMISSFIQPVLKKIRNLNDEIATALLYEYDLQNPVDVAKGLGCSAINPQLHLVDAQFVRIAHRMGLKVNPWVINEPEEMHQFIDFGVDGIITDFPPRLIEILNRKDR